MTDLAVTPLFAADHGALSLDTRLVLCRLLSGPSVEPDSPLWPALLRDEALIRSRLSDLFLELILDRDRKIAFTRQADTGDLDTPVLQRAVPLTFMESVLLLYLRQALVDAEFAGRRAVVDESELLEYLDVYAQTPGADQVSKVRRIRAAIDKMKKNTLLQSIRGTQVRFEVSPVLRLLFTADDVEALTTRYRAMQGMEATGAEGDGSE